LISPWLVIGLGLVAGALASIIAYFMAKTPPSDNQGGESGLPELAEQENFWKRHKKDMKGWT